MHPALTDGVTHLGAVKDTDRNSAGNAGVARVPMALGLYKARKLKRPVRPFVIGVLCLQAVAKQLTQQPIYSLSSHEVLISPLCLYTCFRLRALKDQEDTIAKTS